MNIKELLAKLAEFPPDMRVVAWDGEYMEIFDVYDIYVRDGGSRTQGGMITEPVVVISPFDDGANR